MELYQTKNTDTDVDTAQYLDRPEVSIRLFLWSRNVRDDRLGKGDQTGMRDARGYTTVARCLP